MHHIIVSALFFSAISLMSCEHLTQPDSHTPVADAGSDQAARVGQYVILNGSGSVSGAGDTLIYKWTADPANPASVSFLGWYPSIRVGFVKEGTYRFRLVVNNGIDDSKPDEATVIVTSRSQAIFSDPVMELQVRYALKNPTGELTTHELATLDTIVSDLGFGKVTSLAGIASCTNLKWLVFGINQITDFSPLATLTQLKELDLDQNYTISDISALTGLTNLTKLNLESNNISDISSLRNMTKMVNLNLIENPVTDISSLRNMTELEQLWIGREVAQTFELSGMSVISRFTKLRLLWITASDCRDVSFVSTLVNLQYLRLSFCNVKDITPLANCTQLEQLYMDSDSISDITPLSKLTNLNLLDLRFNQITDIAALVNNSGLGQGDAASLNGNPLDSISINQYIPQLKSRGVVVFY